VSHGPDVPSGGYSSPGVTAVSFTSTRFGEVEVDPGAVIEFPRGLIGLGGTRYALLGKPEEEAIVWLHAIDEPDLAVPVADPWAFFADYAVDLPDDEAERMGISDPGEARVLVVVRVGSTPQDCFANLKAPILVAGGTGHQVLNEADVPLRAPLMPEE
jgi:flagellar assembly factor FliW